MNYELFFENPQSHLIRIRAEFASSGTTPVTVLAPRWRPGRYELGPYVENICDVKALDPNGKHLPFEKTAYNTWLVHPGENQKFFMEYKYYAIDRGAGGSNFDESQVYLNPVNLLLYLKEKVNENCELKLHLPEGYQVACGLRKNGHTLFANDFHELADCPLFASKEMKCINLEVQEIPFHLWFLGNAKPDAARIISDFSKFISAQIDLFGEFPAKEYHFLFQMRDEPFYHGVEHQNSTVIALGPGFQLMSPDVYEEFLGISSHELFHSWNVKAIRPADMQPYDYDTAQYSRLHYVTEGVTTYYGDLMLLKSGVWELEEFLSVMNGSTLKKYYANDGRLHISLEQSSFDSWVNGYKETVPNRRISFYNKGALAAFVLDYKIRKATENGFSLDDVMREMYERFGTSAARSAGRGYTKEDYKGIAETIGGINLDDYFRDYISGLVPVENAVAEAAAYFGLRFSGIPHPILAIRNFGFSIKTNEEVDQVFENSPAQFCGLEKNDHLLAVNGIKVSSGNLSSLLDYFSEEQELRLIIFRGEQLHKLILKPDSNWLGLQYNFSVDYSADAEQMANRLAWMSLKHSTVPL